MVAAYAIVEAMESEGVARARALFEEYAASLPFSLCFQGFDEEMASLPGKYARPRGCILLGVDERIGEAVGTVAVRPLDDPGVCEMKRLYVRPRARGSGLGRRLCERLLAESCAMGYREMRLDTESTMIEAVSLYRSMGFRTIPRYNNDPLPHTVFLGLDLAEWERGRVG